MIIIYCALLPAVMTRFKWHQHRKSEAFLGYYKPSFWWFDTFDLFYRLSMTGMLLAILQKNSEKRMVVSILISTACLSFVYSFRPFLNESHNAILATGQTVVSITIACGYVVTFGEIKGSEVGWLLLSINILLVVFSITQQWFEELHLLLDAILAQGSFDADTVTRLCCGSSVGAISDALLKSACVCLDNVIGGNDERADRYFHYLTKNLLSLKNFDGCLLWDSKIPLGVHWAPHVQHYVNSAVGEFFSSEEAASARDLEGCVTAVRGIFGTLIKEADARATFQNLREAEIDHHSRLSAQDLSFSAGIQRPRSRSSFIEENCFVEMQEMIYGAGIAYEKEEESTVASFEFEDDIERGPSTSGTGPGLGFGAPPVASADENDDDNKNDNNENDDDDDDDNENALEVEKQYDDQSKRQVPKADACDGGVLVLDAIDGIEIEARDLNAAASNQQLSNDEINVSSPCRSSIWFQNERDGLYDVNDMTQLSFKTENPLRRAEVEAWSDDAGNFDSEVFEVETESPPAEKGIDDVTSQFSAELLEAGIRDLHRNLGKGTPPTLFAVVQA
ncbi:MAG: hypothetical protein VXU46_04035, partial [Planctomycetota bacterium]|nr:hypothetical protein [Planctomycetota bacterium]